MWILLRGEEGCEFVEGKGGVTAAVEGIRVEMKDGFSDGGGCGGKDGFW